VLKSAAAILAAISGRSQNGYGKWRTPFFNSLLKLKTYKSGH
jgi:hypothetical protein